MKLVTSFVLHNSRAAHSLILKLGASLYPFKEDYTEVLSGAYSLKYMQLYIYVFLLSLY